MTNEQKTEIAAMIEQQKTEMAVAMTALETLPKSHWKQSYTGKAATCCCGCAGNYSSNSRAMTAQINRIRNIIANGEDESLMIGFPFPKRDLPIEQQVMTEIEWISVERNGRMYTIYAE
jgi:hypothetical protein